jgi:hypothetical protein
MIITLHCILHGTEARNSARNLCYGGGKKSKGEDVLPLTVWTVGHQR